MAPLTALAFGAARQTGAPDSSVPTTTIEQALIEHRCRTTVAAGTPGTAACQECPSVRRLSLRTDFGPDLSRLSYLEAKLKDDPDQVAHLGAEPQEHFTAKAQAVEQADQQLTK